MCLGWELKIIEAFQFQISSYLKIIELFLLLFFLQVSPGRIIRILTSIFPKYFAIISRVREDVRTVGQEGGKVRILYLDIGCHL